MADHIITRAGWRVAAIVALLFTGFAAACQSGPAPVEQEEQAITALQRQLLREREDACFLGDLAACASAREEYLRFCEQGDGPSCDALDRLAELDLIRQKQAECDAGDLATCRELQSDYVRLCNRGNQNACALLDAISSGK